MLELFPEVRVSGLVATGIDNHGELTDAETLLAEARDCLARSAAEGALVEHPRIAPWREAYRRFGAKPKKHRSSIENLARRALRGDRPRSINPLVDLYNVVSMRHFLPLGGEDLDTIEGDLRLTRAAADEPAARLLGDSEARPPNEGEVFYTDERGAVCRRWNWREADRTKLEADTTDAILVIEALPPVTEEELEAAVAELEALVIERLGGTVRRFLLRRGEPSVEFASKSARTSP